MSRCRGFETFDPGDGSLKLLKNNKTSKILHEVATQPAEGSSEGIGVAEAMLCSTIPGLPLEMLHFIMTTMDVNNLLLSREVNKIWKEFADKELERRVISDWTVKSFTPAYTRYKAALFFPCDTKFNDFCLQYTQDDDIPAKSAFIKVLNLKLPYAQFMERVQTFIEAAKTHLTSFRLELLIYSVRLDGTSVDIEKPIYLPTILPDMPNLRALSIRNVVFGPENLMKEPWSSTITVPKLPKLEYLNVSGGDSEQSTERISDWFINNYAHQLVTLKCDRGTLEKYLSPPTTDPPTTDPPTDTPTTTPRQFGQLQAIKIKSDLPMITNTYDVGAVDMGSSILELIPPNSCPKLERIWLDADYHEFVKSLGHLEKFGRTLRELHYKVAYKGEDDHPGLEWRPVGATTTEKNAKKGKRNKRSMSAEFTLMHVVDTLNSLQYKKKLLGVKTLTIPWLKTSGYSRIDGVRKTLQMFPNLETVHLTNCNYWVNRFQTITFRNRKLYHPVSDTIFENLIGEFTREEYGLHIMHSFEYIRRVEFFPETEATDKDCFLKYYRDVDDRIVEVVMEISKSRRASNTVNEDNSDAEDEDSDKSDDNNEEGEGDRENEEEGQHCENVEPNPYVFLPV